MCCFVQVRNVLAALFAAMPLPRALRLAGARAAVEAMEADAAAARATEGRLRYAGERAANMARRAYWESERLRRSELDAARGALRAMRAEHDRLLGLVTSGVASQRLQCAVVV